MRNSNLRDLAMQMQKQIAERLQTIPMCRHIMLNIHSLSNIMYAAILCSAITINSIVITIVDETTLAKLQGSPPSTQVSKSEESGT